jgi:hypothetical protein
MGTTVKRLVVELTFTDEEEVPPYIKDWWVKTLLKKQ